MNWGLLLDAAHRIGWNPERFWAATLYEFTTAMAAHAAMLDPKREGMSDDDLASFLRAQPGYRKEA